MILISLKILFLHSNFISNKKYIEYIKFNKKLVNIQSVELFIKIIKCYYGRSSQIWSK